MDKCREAFERFECEKYEANYDDMKKNWDWYESQFGYRYSPDSLRGKDWAIWQEAWQHQQAKVEELQTLYTQQGINMLKLQKQIDALEKSYFVLARIKSIASKNLLESILIKEVRQALKGEGQ
ncbi:hypothetical protein ACWPOR_04370 [Acinetobacter nosocomialis]